jgi:transcriptional regulator with AAA-type ATPase domain
MTQAALALLGALMWSGNLAELRAVVERAAEETPRELIQIEDVLPALNLERAPARFVPSGQLREARLRFERDYISAVLQHHDWRMAEAAATLAHIVSAIMFLSMAAGPNLLLTVDEIMMLRKFRQVTDEARTQIAGYVEFMFASKKAPD